MKFNDLFLITGCSIIAFALFSACNIDPSITGNKVINTDQVTITKTTKYGKAKDGVSPLKSKLGAVIMSHTTHKKQGIRCVTCHHKDFNDDRIKKCAVCHTGDDGYKTMHGLCVDCHIAKKNGPQKCKQCH